MPHERKRYITQSLNKIIGLSPRVVILGHRQVGKTTLLEQVCGSYYVLDNRDEMSLANQNPDKYIAARAGSRVALDECQLVPDLFPALKDWVGKHKKPGQFILSGSVRFTSREAIRESLTGRLMNLELLPFSVPELEGDPLSKTCIEILQTSNLQNNLQNNPPDLRRVRRYHKLMQKYFSQGGLPGVCFIRESKLREQKIEEQLRTILDRDLRLVQKILLPFSDIRNLVSVLAETQNQPLDYTYLKKETGISTPTIKKIIYALEAVFIIRIIPIEGSTMGSTILFEDQGEAAYLRRNTVDLKTQLSHFIFTNVRQQFFYRIGESVRLFQYRTRGGAFVPICFANKSGVLGLLPLNDLSDLDSVSGTVNSFLSHYERGKIILVHNQDEPPNFIKPRVISAPIGYII